MTSRGIIAWLLFAVSRHVDCCCDDDCMHLAGEVAVQISIDIRRTPPLRLLTQLYNTECSYFCAAVPNVVSACNSTAVQACAATAVLSP